MVFHLAEHHAVAEEHHVVDAAIEEVVTSQLDIEPTLEEVFADTEREHRISAVDPDVRTCVAVGVHVEVSLKEPVVRQYYDVA